MGDFGRPPIDFDAPFPLSKNGKESYWDRLDNLCKHALFLGDCAELLGVDDNTIERNIRKKFNMTFGEYKSRKLGHTRYLIIADALRAVQSGKVDPKTRVFLLECINKLSPQGGEMYSDEESYEEPINPNEQTE